MPGKDTWEEGIGELRRRKKAAKLGGGQRKIEHQHSKGKLTARERLDLLIDPGSFIEFDMFAKSRCRDLGMDKMSLPPGDGCVIGYAKVDGRRACIYATDFTALGGSVGEAHGKKLIKIMTLALETKSPLLLLNDSGGIRPQEQHFVTDNYRRLFYMHTVLSGVVPQITMVMGPVAGGACYGPGLTDFILMVEKTSSMFIGGPPVVKAIQSIDITPEELGGASVHCRKSGVADMNAATDAECIQKVKELLSFLPSNNELKPPVVDTGDDPNRMNDDLVELVPSDFNRPYDMHLVIRSVVDNGHFLELKPEYARNMIIGFARLNGHTVGIIANQPKVLGGSVDVPACKKVTRHVRFCDAFNIPLVHFVDSPSYMVGPASEQEGIIKYGAATIYAECEATVPKLSVVIRKGFGGPSMMLGGVEMGGDTRYSWPLTHFGTFGLEAGINIILSDESIKETLAMSGNSEQVIQDLRREYEEKILDLYDTASLRGVTDIIEPRETRQRLIKALDIEYATRRQGPWKKHGNMPF